MNNEDAYEFLNQSESSSNAARKYIKILDLDESKFNALKSKFNKLKLSRINYLKMKNIDAWNSQPFVPVDAQENNFPKKRKCVSMDYSIVTVATENFCRTCNSQTICLNCSDGIFAEQNSDLRKYINELKMESQRSRLNVSLQHINFIASRKGLAERILQLVALK